MDQDEHTKGWFWGRAIALLVACSGAVAGLNIYLKGVETLSNPSGAGEAVGSAIGLWALGGIASVIAYFVGKPSSKSLLKIWVVGCCVVFGLIAYAQTYRSHDNGITLSSEARRNLIRKFGEAHRTRDYSIVQKEIEPLAKQGNAVAQLMLATSYSNGYGVIQDDKISIKWLTLAAEQGYIPAQSSLAFRYEEGENVARDYKAALKWYTLAAEQGDTSSQITLGHMYWDGRGTVQDFSRAHMWFNIAASLGSDWARGNMNLYAQGMSPSQLETAQRLARECVDKDYKGC